ncbi:Mutator MutT [gamma proteobacterium HdN1]|nr:Mutator MutT [gamma proteobacterium HdN1]
MTTPVHVVAAVIRGRDGRILLAQRPAHLHQGGKWEFPGGKVEAGEGAEQALARELREELGITPVVTRPLIQVQHRYPQEGAHPEKTVFLDVWEVVAFSGQPSGRERQRVEWVAQDALEDYEFPPANQPIVVAAQLPSTILITPEPAEFPAESFYSHLDASLEAGVGWVILRSNKLSAQDFTELAAGVAELCAEFEVPLSLNPPPEVLKQMLKKGDAGLPEGVGLHLSEAALREYQDEYDGCVSASCHSPEALRLAEERNVTFALLSPIQATASHPDVEPLGWVRASEWIKPSKVPIYALGSLGNADVIVARKNGAQGVAGIRAFWK